MSDRYFPPISSENLLPLKVLQQHLADDAGYLNDPECPYDDDTKDFILEVFGSTGGAAGVSDIEGTVAEIGDIEDEVTTLYTQLKTFSGNLKEAGAGDNAEWMSFFRTATSLLEKLVGLKERARGVKEIREFQRVVLNILDDVMTPDQRNEFTEKLEKYRNEGS